MNLYDKLVEFQTEERKRIADRLKMDSLYSQNFHDLMTLLLVDLLTFDNQFIFKRCKDGSYKINHKKNWFAPPLYFTRNYFDELILMSPPSILCELHDNRRLYSQTDFFFEAITIYFRRYIV